MSKARIINFKPTPRPKSNLIPFLSVVLIGALIMSMCGDKVATAQKVKNDTIEGEYTPIVSSDTMPKLKDKIVFIPGDSLIGYKEDDEINLFIGLANNLAILKMDTSFIKETLAHIRRKKQITPETKIIEVQISHYATRDTLGNWKIYNAERALEAMYRSYMYDKDMYRSFLQRTVKAAAKYLDLSDKYKVERDSVVGLLNKSVNSPSPSPLPDTIPAKKYHYFLTIKRIDFNTWNNSIDTLQGVHSIIGKSLLKDQADFNYELASRQIQRIFEHMSVDSVLIQEPKTKK